MWNEFPDNYSVNKAQADAKEHGIKIDELLDKLVDHKNHPIELNKIKSSLEKELEYLKIKSSAGEYNVKTYLFYRAFTNIMYESVGISDD